MTNNLRNQDVERMATDYITLNMAYGKPVTYIDFYVQTLSFIKEMLETQGEELSTDEWKRLVCSLDVQTILAWKVARSQFKALAARL